MSTERFVTMACGQVGKETLLPDGQKQVTCQTCFRDPSNWRDLPHDCDQAEKFAKGRLRESFHDDHGLLRQSKSLHRERLPPDRAPLHPWGSSGAKILHQQPQHIPHPLVELPAPYHRRPINTRMPASCLCPYCGGMNALLNYSVQTHSLYQGQISDGHLISRTPMGLRETRVMSVLASCVDCTQTWLFDARQVDELTDLGHVERRSPILGQKQPPTPASTTPVIALDAGLPAPPKTPPLIQPEHFQALAAPEDKQVVMTPACQPIVRSVEAPPTPRQHFNIAHLRPFLTDESVLFSEANVAVALAAAVAASHITLLPKVSQQTVVRRLCLQGVVNRAITRELIGGATYYRWVAQSDKR